MMTIRMTLWNLTCHLVRAIREYHPSQCTGTTSCRRRIMGGASDTWWCRIYVPTTRSVGGGILRILFVTVTIRVPMKRKRRIATTHIIRTIRRTVFVMTTLLLLL